MLDSTVTSIDWVGQGYGVANMGANQVYARFFSKPKLMPYESEQAGRPIYRDVDYVEIFIAGDKTTAPVYEATLHYQRRFAREWAAYKENREQQVSGTPLSFLFPGDQSLVLELEGHRVRTIEQLAAMSHDAARFPRALQLIDTAKAFLAKASNRETEVADLKAQNDALAARLAALEAAAQPKRGPGRPPKAKAPEPEIEKDAA